MLQRKNKKGFTLAELLIVVAILAVLTAIAVPLFVGALNDAEERVAESNCSAVRGLAISQILLKEQASDIETIGTGEGNDQIVCYGYGIVSPSGSVSDLDYYIGKKSAFNGTGKSTGTWGIQSVDTESSGATKTTDGTGYYKKAGDTTGYYILVEIVKSTIKTA